MIYNQFDTCPSQAAYRKDWSIRRKPKSVKRLTPDQAKKRNRILIENIQAGMSKREAAEKAGVSKQRAYQIWKRHQTKRPKLNISVRLANAIFNQIGKKYSDDDSFDLSGLLQLSAKEWVRVPNFGFVCLVEMQTLLDKRGLSLTGIDAVRATKQWQRALDKLEALQKRIAAD
jgi:DNA-binding XRE family transcriptional regulator